MEIEEYRTSTGMANLVAEEARYGDNVIVAAYPNDGIEETYEFRENDEEELVLMYAENSGVWEELPAALQMFLALFPLVPVNAVVTRLFGRLTDTGVNNHENTHRIASVAGMCRPGGSATD